MWPHFISDPHHVTITMNLGESVLKLKKFHIHKNDAEAHGPKLMVI